MLTCDIIIIGGGIAGLWTLNCLRKQNYHAILLEKNALGAGQTIASQGIIHGGIKYSLQGALSRSSQEISDMPAIWYECLQGKGIIDLSATKVLSEHYYLCSQQKITQSITQFFAQKALRSQSHTVAKNTLPEFFDHPDFKGLLTQVDECVLDVPTLIKTLAEPVWPYIFKVDEINLSAPNTVHISEKTQTPMTLNAQKIILTAGAGNAGLLPQAKMQTRPLNMVMLMADNLPKVFLHCVHLNTNPVLTITSHTADNGQCVWYLGGQLAEDGVMRDDANQINIASNLIAQQFPWLNLKNPKWRLLRIDRAEGFNHGKRPESVMITEQDNIITAWPTKLTFAPLLADKILSLLPKSNSQEIPSTLQAWPKPEIAATPWSDLC